MASRALYLSFLLTVLVPDVQAAQLDLPPAGASSCSGCHAPPGVDTAVPSLDGRKAADIVAQMLSFRSGARAATVMDRIAKGFSDSEIEAIATWYARRK